MSPRPARFLAALAALVIAATLLPAGPAEAAARRYASCAALQKTYANGVATSKRAAAAPAIHPPKVSASLYAANRTLDRDRDGVVCERARPTKDQVFAAAMADAGNPDAALYRGADPAALGRYGAAVCALVAAKKGNLPATLTAMWQRSAPPVTDRGDAFTLGAAVTVYCPKYLP
ncbi:DUF732 domain-containing protein [Spirilliplanes yamanashiensis]|uniref:Excalibur calcium-binding domain-containing protein n=1 Tax=Spirilliplanes yamanashiensis TaxID=42233 RepID=A0A8J3Y439_9ACTN|nr:DUF732 domain-containing protein [Spirilliplanes yamanashiensis]MDP9820152.1 hypothetical protein [Spirilliplanes yamanashiensis]GIJ01028.1 hypothetical protein Sya03_03800 [Spirilliplanes yamanashiensis]